VVAIDIFYMIFDSICIDKRIHLPDPRLRYPNPHKTPFLCSVGLLVSGVDKTIFMDNQTKTADPKEVIRVSISEGARLFGVNPQTIRRAIRDQELTYVVVAGRYKINFESLVKWSQRKTTVNKKTIKYGIGQYVDKWKISNTLYSPSTRVWPKRQERRNTNNFVETRLGVSFKFIIFV